MRHPAMLLQPPATAASLQGSCCRAYAGAASDVIGAAAAKQVSIQLAGAGAGFAAVDPGEPVGLSADCQVAAAVVAAVLT